MDNHIETDADEGALDRERTTSGRPGCLPTPVDHWRQTILSLAGTVVLVAVLTLSLASVV
jgi:hypothetical protein